MLEFPVPDSLRPLIDIEMRFLQCQSNISIWTHLWHLCPSEDVTKALSFFIAERRMLQESFNSLCHLITIN